MRPAPPRWPGRWPSAWPLQPLRARRWSAQEPTYDQADPNIIAAALKRASARPSGNWFVFAASREVRADQPFGVRVGGIELVAWRDDTGKLRVGPGACPHLGAPLAEGSLDCGTLVCRWHGLRLDGTRRNGWEPLPAFDDGVLAWVRLDNVGGEQPLQHPLVPDRPAYRDQLNAVATIVGECEPEDVVANRLDPWHGAWFHPYSFAELTVVDAPGTGELAAPDDRFIVDVTFRVAPRLGVPVRAEFTCPGPRTVVMRILEGEGQGSVVETHATPLAATAHGAPRTAVIEATVAGSSRSGFRWAARAGWALRPVMRSTAARLWRDDMAYAERRYRQRTHQR